MTPLGGLGFIGARQPVWALNRMGGVAMSQILESLTNTVIAGIVLTVIVAIVLLAI